MKNLRNNLILLISLLMVLSAPVYADKPSDDVFEVPSIEQTISENKPQDEPVIIEETLEEDIEPDLSADFTNDNMWKNARYIGTFLIGIIFLFLIFNFLKRKVVPTQDSSGVVLQKDESPSTENFDKALNTFIQRNID